MEIKEILSAIQKAADTIATPNCAAWLSAVAAVGAVVVAIIIALKQNEIAEEQTKISKKQAEISEQQNKIALFDKRIFVYEEISKVTSLGSTLVISGKLPIRIVFDNMIQYLNFNIIEDEEHPWILLGSLFLTQHTQTNIKQAAFIFPQVTEHDVDDLWKKFHAFFIDFTYKTAKYPDMLLEDFSSESKSDFIAASDYFRKKYFPDIVKCLHF